MALQTSRDATVVKIERALELFAQKIPTLGIDRVAFIGDITNVLWLCGQNYPGSSSSGGGKMPWPLLYFGFLFSQLRHMLGTSKLADCNFHLYTTAGANTKMGLPAQLPWESVPDVLADLEDAVGQFLGSRNIMILMVQGDSGLSWVSKASSQCFRDAFGADLINSHHERHGMLVQEREPSLIALSQPPVLSQPFWNSGRSAVKIPYVDALTTPFSKVPEYHGLHDNFFGDGGRSLMAAAPSTFQSVSGNEQLRPPSQYQSHLHLPGWKKGTHYDSGQNPLVADIFDASQNTNMFPIPQPQGIEHTYFSDPSEPQASYNTLMNAGNKGLDTAPLAIAPSAHPSSPTNAMIQFAAHIEKYGKQRAAEAEENLSKFLALQLSSTHIAKHPKFPSEVLRRVATRENPKFHLSGLDLSCAFVVCDLRQPDLPIIYASNACEQLTGYTGDEIVGQNFLFMHFPDKQRNSGVQRRFYNSHALHTLECHITLSYEHQTHLTSYNKWDQPFRNVLTVIPIRWDGGEDRFYVGFMIDLAEHPDCVSAVSPDGRLVVNYSPTQTSNPVDEPDDESEHERNGAHTRSPTTNPANQPAGPSLGHEPRTQTSRSARNPGGTAPANHTLQRSITNPTDDPSRPADQQASMPPSKARAEQSAVPFMTSPEADSPWSERDGLPPPYALSPGVFYHTSRMAMLSP